MPPINLNQSLKRSSLKQAIELPSSLHPLIQKTASHRADAASSSVQDDDRALTDSRDNNNTFNDGSGSSGDASGEEQTCACSCARSLEESDLPGVSTERADTSGLGSQRERDECGPPAALAHEGTQCRPLHAVCLACAAYTASVLDNALSDATRSSANSAALPNLPPRPASENRERARRCRHGARARCRRAGGERGDWRRRGWGGGRGVRAGGGGVGARIPAPLRTSLSLRLVVSSLLYYVLLSLLSSNLSPSSLPSLIVLFSCARLDR
ncbi:hypothetical protein C8R45DRAFT_356586 [Mycena sanguinolenta]|nr:hypothetical protein C8R45DRAFT_356586 [Mycena sanguinolenta]